MYGSGHARGGTQSARYAVPWYSFVTQWPDGRLADAGTTNSPDDDAARRYARLLIHELKARAEYHDPGLRMIVRNSKGDVIQIIPF